MENEASAFRAFFPEHEALYPWLSTLLDALAVIDRGIQETLDNEEHRPRRDVACDRGCHACCVAQMIPVSPLEISGLSWYATEMLQGEQRNHVKRLLVKTRHKGCRFLHQGACAVYPLRPIACRQFIVYGTPCAAAEDVFVTRNEDVFKPNPEYKRRADAIMLPHYGFKSREMIDQALQEQHIRKASQLLFACDWKALYRRMAARDKRAKVGGPGKLA